VLVGLAAICGSDLHGFREASPRRIPPLVMGHEVMGKVEAAGPGVDPALVGTRVVVKPIVACGQCDRCRAGRTNLCANGKLMGRDMPGGFAQLLLAPASHVVSVAEALSDDLATLVEPFANAVHVAGRAVTEGDSVLVIGAGPIGLLMTRAAKLAGAVRVVATDRIPSRLSLAEEQGADAVVEAPKAPPGDADVVIDAVGLEQTMAVALDAVRPGGRVELVGLGAGSGTVDYFKVIGKEAQITGSFAWGDADFARSLELLEKGAVDATGWFTRMPLAEGQAAFERLVDTTELVKVVLAPRA